MGSPYAWQTLASYAQLVRPCDSCTMAAVAALTAKSTIVHGLRKLPFLGFLEFGKAELEVKSREKDMTA